MQRTRHTSQPTHALWESRWWLPLWAWGIALVLLVGLFWQQGITPFGPHNLLIGDLGAQYMAFLTDFTRLIHQHVWTVYNFHQGLGANWVPIISYYVMSPFNLLLFLFKSSRLPVAVSLIILLKIATIAGTMTFYLQEHWQRRDRFLVVFGLAFAFCGFVAANFFNLMWLDALIILPLVTWGVDVLIRTRRSKAYYWWLLASILINYYLGYMTCLFIVGYFIYRLGVTAQGGHGWWTANRSVIRRFVGASLLSGGSSWVILWPTVLGMLQTPKLAEGAGNFNAGPLFGLEFFSQFQMGASNFAQRLSHGPSVFVSSLVVLLALAFFCLPQVSRREKWWSLGLLGYLFLGMWIRGLNTFWHMLAVPASYPFRNSFFFSFVLILLAANAWQADVHRLKWPWRLGLPLGFAALMVAGVSLLPHLQRDDKLGAYAASLQPWNWSALWWSLLSLAVVALLLWHHTPSLDWLLGALVIVELLGNFSWSLVGADYGNQAKFAAAYQTAAEGLQGVTQSNKLYRVRNDLPTVSAGFAGHYNGYNDPMWLGYNGTSGYSSTIQTRTIALAHQLGIFARNDRRLSDVGFTPVTELLWGVRLKMGKQGLQTVRTYNGMGFAVPQKLTRLGLSNDAMANQETILQDLRPSKRPYFMPVREGADHVRATWAVNGHATQYVYNHVWTITPRTTGRLYLVDPTAQSKFSTISVNHHVMRPAMNVNGQAVMINLGIRQKNKPLLVKFASHKASTKAIRLATLDPNALHAVQQQIAPNALLLHRKHHHFRTVYAGTVRATRQTPELFLSLPTEEGWHIQIDGHKAHPYTALTGLTAVPIKPGQHHVAISYRAPGVILGVFGSLLCLDVAHIFRRRDWL